MRLESIGFYTLSDQRAATASMDTQISRLEIILGARCNFNCPYCRHVGGKDLAIESAKNTIDVASEKGLFAIRFSGGEPTIYPYLNDLVLYAKSKGAKKIAISSNGSASLDLYKQLIESGVNDFSISLDACCAEDCDKMTGGIKGAWETVVSNIRELSKLTYVTVGVVLTDQNMESISGIIRFASDLGVADIRIIPAAQDGDRIKNVQVDDEILQKHPILNYRIQNIRNNIPVRGMSETDSRRCGIVLDDLAVIGENHFPCIIYARESGKPIGKIGPNMREERASWFAKHDTYEDPICRKNCLDCIVLYNNRFSASQPDAVRLAKMASRKSD